MKKTSLNIISYAKKGKKSYTFLVFIMCTFVVRQQRGYQVLYRFTRVDSAANDAGHFLEYLTRGYDLNPFDVRRLAY